MGKKRAGEQGYTLVQGKGRKYWKKTGPELNQTITKKTLTDKTGNIVPNPFDHWENKPPTPSSLATKIFKKQEWGPSDKQTSYGSGVVNFSAAGHGGVVVLPGIAEVDSEWLEACRNNGLTQTYYVIHDGNSPKTLGPASHYRKKQLTDWLAIHKSRGNEIAEIEAIIGEEDCDWATAIAACGPKHREKWNNHHQEWFADMNDHYIHAKVKNYNPDIWEKVTGEKVSAAESSVVEEREFRAENAERWVTVSASNTEDPDYVRVTATKGGTRTSGTERNTFMIPKNLYQPNKYGYVIPEEFIES